MIDYTATCSVCGLEFTEKRPVNLFTGRPSAFTCEECTHCRGVKLGTAYPKLYDEGCR